MTAVSFRTEQGKNGDFTFRLPVPEWGEGGKRFAGYYRNLTALLSSVSPGKSGFTSVTGTGRAAVGEVGMTTVLLLCRFYFGKMLESCFLDTVTWDEEGNAVPLARLIGKKAAKKAAREGSDGWYAGKTGVIFCRYRVETDPESGRLRAVFRETGSAPFLCRKKECRFRKLC